MSTLKFKDNRIATHTGWHHCMPRRLNNDYALLQLESAFTKNASIQFACLPYSNLLETNEAKVIAAGWGRVRESGSFSPENLRVVDLRIQAGCGKYESKGYKITRCFK